MDASSKRDPQTDAAHTAIAEDILYGFKDFFSHVFGEIPTSGDGVAHPGYEWYRSLFNVTQDPIFACPLLPDGTAGPFLEVNEAACSVLGYQREALLRLTIYDVLDPVPDTLTQTLAEHRHASFEAAALTSDRQRMPMGIRVQLFALEESEVMLVICRDVSERRRAETFQAHLAAIVASSDDAILSKTVEGIITSWNAAAERIYGYTAAEAIGQHITLIVPEDRHAEIDQIHKSIAHGERVEPFETIRRTKDGTSIPISLTVSPIHGPDGVIIGASAIARDISASKAAEEELRRSRAELQDFVENATLGLHWVGPDGTILWANQAELDMLGYERDAYIGHNISEFHADQETIQDILRRLKNREELHSYEARLRARDGSIRHVLISSNVYWEGDEFMHTRCFTRNVTERKHAEDALREREAAYRALVQAIPDALFTFSADGVYLDFMPAHNFEPMVPPEQFLGRSVREIQPPEVAEPFLAAVRRAHAEQTLQELEFSLDRDGQIRYYDVRLVPRGTEVLGIVRDVSERRIAETQLQNEHAFRHAIEVSIPAGVAATDLDGQQIYVNPAFCEIVGWPEDDLVGQKPPYPYWPPEEIDNIQQAFESTLRGEAPRSGFEMRFQRRTGERFEVLVVAAALTDRDGRTEGFLASVTDISERKAAEERNRFHANILSQVSDAVVATDREQRITYLNEAFARMMDLDAETALGQPIDALYSYRWLHADDAEASASALAASGTWNGEIVLIRQDQREIFADFSVSTLTDDTGNPTGRLAVIRDVTERHQAGLRTRFLAEAGTVLTASLDYEVTLNAVADLLVPGLADWCAVYITDHEGALDCVAVAHTDPEKVQFARALQERYPPDLNADFGVPKVIRTGVSEFLPHVPESALREAAQDEEHYRILAGLHPHSAMAVPLVARGRGIGAISLVMSETPRAFTEADLDLAEELARRCALSVDNARLYREAQNEIAERKMAQEALRESERQLRFTLEAAHVGTWNWHIQTNKVQWSSNLEAIHRLAPGTFDGTFESFLADVDPDDRAHVQQAIAQAIETGSDYHVEYRLPDKNGQSYWVEGKGTVLADAEGRPARLAGICMDITERKRAETLVSNQKRVLELIAQGAPLPDVLDLLIRSLEAQAEGKLLASILLLDEDGHHLHHGAAPNLPTAYNEAIDGIKIGEGVGSCGTAAFRAETVVVSNIATDPLWKDFKKLALGHGLQACWSTPLFDTQGRVLGTIAIYYPEPREPADSDRHLVSLMMRTAAIAIERHRAEQHLREFNETLEQKVTDRTAALREANTQLRQRNRELQDFAYAASHDLQEPLRKISAFSNLMDNEYGDSLDEEGRFYLERMRQAAIRMSGLITDLLAFSRVTTQGRPFQPVDLEKIIDEVLSDLEIGITEADARIEVGSMPQVTADPIQMRQLFQNLIGNAIKFRRKDVPPVVAVRGWVEESENQQIARFEIEDNGIGFDEKYHDRIFSPFQRLHGRSTYPGSGIGLALCRRIIERHRGKITVRSTPGEGSCFIVTIPLHQQYGIHT